MTTYLMISSTSDMAIRVHPNITFQRVVNQNNLNIVNGYIIKNTRIIGRNFVEINEDIKNIHGSPIGNKGDKWLEVELVGGIPTKGFVAFIHMDRVYANIQEIPDEISITSIPEYTETITDTDPYNL
jgi:hypothetical protein